MWFCSLFSWTCEARNSDNCSWAETKINQNSHRSKWNGINQGKRLSWHGQMFWLLGRAVRLQHSQLQYEVCLQPFENAATGEVALGVSGCCLHCYCSILWIKNPYEMHSLFFFWGLIIIAVCPQFLSLNFRDTSCEGEVELRRGFRRRSVVCHCSAPCFNIHAVTVTAVWLSGERQAFLGWLGGFPQGNTWEALTCIAPWHRKAVRERVLWNLMGAALETRWLNLFWCSFHVKTLRGETWRMKGIEKGVLLTRVRFTRESHLVVTVHFSSSLRTLSSHRTFQVCLTLRFYICCRRFDAYRAATAASEQRWRRKKGSAFY